VQRKVTITIDEQAAGMGLLDLLASRFTYHTREAWQGLIAEGALFVNESQAHPEQTLQLGDVLRYECGTRTEPSVDKDYRILFRDEALLVVDKPGNLPCHPAGRYFKNTLWSLLQEQEQVEQPRLVNRLDRETSGLVVVGQTLEASRHLANQFAAHTVEKGYLVLVEGAFPEQLDAAGWLIHDHRSVVRKKRAFVREQPHEGASEPCETRFVAVERYGDVSVVRAYPKTGCLHQIRATLCSLGFPVVGDKLYGVDDTFFVKFIEDSLTDEDKKRLRLPRQALHAESLQLTHPLTGERLSFQAPVPKDMGALLFPRGGDCNQPRIVL
jgi:RluA family pseudouridine synthase